MDGQSCNISWFNFTDAHDRAITSMYKHAYFVGLIFAVHESTMKNMKVDPSKISRYTAFAMVLLCISSDHTTAAYLCVHCSSTSECGSGGPSLSFLPLLRQGQ